MGRKMNDLTGKRFERLVVLSFLERKNKKMYWKVKCDCGTIGIARGDKLVTGVKKSCGCLYLEKRELNLTAHATPGMFAPHYMGRSDD
jgi:hypothetical protein